MILRFLRLFPQFRAIEERQHNTLLDLSEARDEAARERDELRAALQEENTQKLILQDRLDAAQESVSRLWGMVDAAQQRAYRAMEMQVNYSTQQRFGVTPYPEASHLPPSLEPDLESDSIVRRRMAPSELIADQKRKLRNEIVDRLTKTA